MEVCVTVKGTDKLTPSHPSVGLCTYFTDLAYHVPLWTCLRCLKVSVGSCWPGINVVKRWWYGVDLLQVYCKVLALTVDYT